jgi:hypothetical protein
MMFVEFPLSTALAAASLIVSWVLTAEPSSVNDAGASSS